MTVRQRITTSLATAVLAGGLVASLAFAPIAGAGEMRTDSGFAAATLVLDKKPAQDAENRAPSDLAREGMEKMLQAINKLIESVPQYQMPEITENGDIILRRKKPDAPAQPAQQQPSSRDESAPI